MGQPNFWDNQERAQQIIQQLKPLNGLLKPAEDLETARGDLQVLAELAEEDAQLEAELDVELTSFEKRLEEFELHAMLSGPYDAGNAFLSIQAGTGGTEACDWAQMLLRMYIRWAERHGYSAELVDELGGVAVAPPCASSATTPTATCRARPACTAWCGSARSTPTRGG